MKKSILALLLLIIAGLVAVGFLIGGDEQRGPGEAGERTQAGSAQQGAASEEAELLALNQAPGSGAPTQAARSGLAKDVRLYGDWEALSMPGQLLLPAGAPEDDSLRVLVLSKPLAPVLVYGERGLLMNLTEKPEDEAKGLMATCDVASDGSFSVPYPADGTPVWLVVDGRFLYLEEAVALEPGSDACTLEPLLGASIKGQLQLPPGPHGPQALDDATTWSDLRLLVSADPALVTANLATSPWAFRRKALPGEQAGEYIFRALPAELPVQLQAKSHILADFEQAGIELERGQELLITASLGVGATISGWVFDPDGAPVAGANLKYATEFTFGIPSKLAATAISDEEGSFTLMGLGASSGSVTAELEGFKHSQPYAVEVAAGQALEELELYLERGASLIGVVRFNDGSFAPNAKIRVTGDAAAMGGLDALGGGLDNRGKAQADALGNFEVRGLGTGPFQVSAVLQTTDTQPEELWFARKSGIEPGQADIELVMDRTSRIVGHVLDQDGAPVTSFVLRAELADSTDMQAAFARQLLGTDTPQDLTDLPSQTMRRMAIEHPEGEFELQGLIAGIWSLGVSAEGFSASPRLVITLPGEAGAKHVIRMIPEASVTGVVVTPSGDPVEGAKVTLQLSRTEALESALGQRAVPVARSDAEGRFELKNLAPSLQAIVAEHGDYSKSLPVEIDPIAGQALRDLTLTLAQGGSLRGEVFGSDGEPAVGVRVVIQSQSEVMPVMRKSGEGGSFHAEHLPPGKYTVTAIFDRGAGTSENAMAEMLDNIKFGMVDIVEGQESEIVLGKAPLNPVEVSGYVLHLGEPVASALVSFLPEDGKGFSDMSLTTTKADGSYSTKLGSPGDFMVTVQVLQGGAGQQQQVEFNRSVPKGKSHGLDLELPGSRISGRVEDRSGKPLASARVSLNIETGALAGTLLGGHYAELTTNAEGAYSFEFLSEGSYSVSAGGPPFGGAFGTRSPYGREIQSPIRVGPEEHRSGVDFRLGESGDLGGKVVDAQGQPVNGASIFVRDERGRLLERFTVTSTGADGAFEYLGLAPGNYTVSAHADGTASRADVGVRVRANEMANIDVPIDAGTMLVIELIDSSGAAIAGSKLSVKNEEGHEMSGMFNLTTMLERFEDGFKPNVYRVGPLPPGKYTALAESPDGRSVRKKVLLSSRARPERKLKLTIN